MSETRSFASAEHGKEEVKEKYMENTGWHAVYFITPFRKNAPFISIPFSLSEKIKWDKVFKNRPSKISERQPLRNLKGYDLSFKGCLPQILLGPFLNTSSQIKGKNR